MNIISGHIKRTGGISLILAAFALAFAPAPADAQPRIFMLNGMKVELYLAESVTAGDDIWIQAVVWELDGQPWLLDRRVTLDTSALGRQGIAELRNRLTDDPQALTASVQTSLYAPPGPVTLRLTASADLGRGGTFDVPLNILAPPDSDGDGMPDLWETRMGLSPSIAGGADGAGGDPDGDGLGNLEEFHRRSHPRGFHARYFAEGARGFFTQAMSAYTTAWMEASVLVRTLDEEGLAEAEIYRASSLNGGISNLGLRPPSGAFAQIVESDVPVIAATRTTTWPFSQAGTADLYGSHASEGTPTLSTRWLFAEGATGAAFSTFLLLVNPSASTATITVTYLGVAGTAPVVRQHTIGPERRATIDVNADAAGLDSTDVAFIVDSSVPIAAERSVYLQSGSEPWGAGTSSVGAPAPSAVWYFAEGLTNPVFDTYLLLLNPGETAANVSIELLRADGLTPLVIERTVAPRARATVHLNSAHASLSTGSTAFGLVVRSTNAVPIVAERTMWWDDPVRGAHWIEGHTSMGATAPATAWTAGMHWMINWDGRFASGYLLIANPGETTATVHIEQFAAGANPPRQTVTVPARARVTVDLASGFTPATVESSIPLIVTSLGPWPAPIVVERSVYASSPSATWTLGTNSMLTPVP